MKRFYLFVLLTFVSIPLLAKNKISMVTYFPVPYVAYSQVNTTDQMDIGLTSACDMKLGCSEESVTLNATRVNLKGGKLNLDGGLGIKGYSLNLGSGNGDGRISFQNVRIQTGNMESVNAGDIKATNLNLFGKAFPSCKAASSESGGQMQWASLKLKGASSNELYLTCGSLGNSSEPEKPTCTQKPHPSTSCEVYYGRQGLQAQEDWVGSVQYAWDENICDWKYVSDTCEKTSCQWVAVSSPRASYQFNTSQRGYCALSVTKNDVEPAFNHISVIYYTSSGQCKETPKSSKELCVNLSSPEKVGMMSCPFNTPAYSMESTINSAYRITFGSIYVGQCNTSRL